MSVLDQNERIQALGFLSWLCLLQVTQPITTFLKSYALAPQLFSAMVISSVILGVGPPIQLILRRP